MLRRPLLSKSPLFATLFANGPVDKRPEAVSNPMSRQ
jgi:hypothetical protein